MSLFKVAMFPDSVTCPITNCTHQVVYKDQNKKNLLDYVESMINTMNSVKHYYAYFAIGIECKAKHEAIDDIGIIELAQFFDTKPPKYITYQNSDLKVNLKNGFIIIEPDDEIKANLSKLFQHYHTYIVFFNIYRDLSSLWNHGIKLNIMHIIDASYRDQITAKNLRLNQAIHGLEDRVEFSALAKAQTRNSWVDWSKRLYTQQSLSNEEAIRSYNDILQYASNNLFFTALSIFDFLKFYGTLFTGFLKCQKRVKSFNKKYAIHPNLPLIREQLNCCLRQINAPNIPKPYSLWSNLYQILPYFEVIENHLPDYNVEREQLEKRKQECEELIINNVVDASTMQSSITFFTPGFKAILDEFKINGDLRDLFLDQVENYPPSSDPKEVFEKICEEFDRGTHSDLGDTYQLLVDIKNDDKETIEQVHTELYEAIPL